MSYSMSLGLIRKYNFLPPKRGIKRRIESPRVHRRPVCLSQATLPDSFKLS